MKKKKVFGHEMYVFVDDPVKEYYGARNRIYSIIQNSKTKKEAKKSIRLFMAKRFYCVFTCKCKKFKTIKMLKLAKKHAFKGILGPLTTEK